MSTHLHFLCCVILTVIHQSFTDIYLHNPRGSNNRHNERTRDRSLNTLSFDSQNNNRGGYNVGDDGRMYYYTGSILPIQWTNQHSCNDVNADCTVLLQYTCNDALRDGQSTKLIPVTVEGEANDTFRLTEDLTSYLNCRVRSRNKNLFIANQALRDSAIYTRQSPDGERYGYECPEERDYYPYWQPSNWIDIAILTNRKDLCSYYRANSQNVQSRYACTFDNKNDLIRANDLKLILPITKEECEAFNTTSLNIAKPRWREYPSHNQPAPECYTPAYTRENHLGDTHGSDMPVYNWTIPKTNSNKCILRVRYNISTGDYDGWKTDASGNRGNLYIMKEYFADEREADKRGYRYQGKPKIQLFDGLNLTFQLAIDTTQYGRVFQDRSFVFEVRSAPEKYQNKPIYNLNVRGRRGNIVQVYPAVEYDFVPNRLEASPDSYVHIQWIGSNTTPQGAGQGNLAIDRNNLLMLTNQKIDPNWNQFQYLNFTGLFSANYPEYLNQSSFLKLPRSDLRRLAASGENTDRLLNNASAYFDLAPHLLSSESVGVYHYVSTRNNDFSNRDQKGRIIVQPFQFKYYLLGANSYSVPIGDALFKFPEGCVNDTISIKIAKLPQDQLPKILPINGQKIVAKESLYDHAYTIEPYDLRFSPKIQMEIPISVFKDDEDSISVLQFEPENGVYVKLPTTVDKREKKLSFQSDIGGIYVFVKSNKTPIWIAGIIIPVALILIIIISTIVYFRLSPSRYTRVRDQLTKTKRSFFSRI